MIRKIIGFLPVVFWTVMLYFGGVELMNPMATGWDITRIPQDLWIWFALSLFSGILLCFRGMIPIGLMLGLIPSAYLMIGILSAGFSGAAVVPVLLTMFYVLYAVCYYTYHKELNKP